MAQVNASDVQALAQAVEFAVTVGMILAIIAGLLTRTFVDLVADLFYQWRASRRFSARKRRQASRLQVRA